MFFHNVKLSLIKSILVTALSRQLKRLKNTKDGLGRWLRVVANHLEKLDLSVVVVSY